MDNPDLTRLQEIEQRARALHTFLHHHTTAKEPLVFLEVAGDELAATLRDRLNGLAAALHMPPAKVTN